MNLWPLAYHRVCAVVPLSSSFPYKPRQNRPPYQSFPFRPLPASSRNTLSSPNYMSCHVFWTQHKIYSLMQQPPPPGTVSFTKSAAIIRCFHAFCCPLPAEKCLGSGPVRNEIQSSVCQINVPRVFMLALFYVSRFVEISQKRLILLPKKTWRFIWAQGPCAPFIYPPTKTLGRLMQKSPTLHFIH